MGGEKYVPLKCRAPGNFPSRNVQHNWGLSDMDWWNRVRGQAVFGPTKYGSCAGMLTSTEAFNKAVHDHAPVARDTWDKYASQFTRNYHSSHDLQMVGKCTRLGVGFAAPTLSALAAAAKQ